MAKMFYTIEEVCSKLSKSEDEIKQMVSSGQVQEFRDKDKLMFKVEQIDLLAGDDDTGEVHLDLGESSGDSGLALESEASALGLTDSREGTGVSVFDTDHGTGADDPSDGTSAGDMVEDELSLDAVGSGSGLLDLTRESDETSLGAELLEEVYSSEENVEIPAHASGLFEAAGTESPGDASAAVHAGGLGATMPVLVETYDGTGSGLGIGLLIGAMAALICVAIIVIVGITGATPALAVSFASNIYVYCGGLLGVTIVFGLVGLFIGKSSE